MLLTNRFSFKFILLSFVLSLITGCAKQPNKKAAQAKAQAAFFVDNLQTNIDIITKNDDQLLIDTLSGEIPSMVGSIPLHTQQTRTDGQMIFAWHCLYDLSTVMQFYTHEMVVHGWRHIGQIEDLQESMLIFKKPKQICVISIRAVTTLKNIKSSVHAFVCTKLS